MSRKGKSKFRIVERKEASCGSKAFELSRTSLIGYSSLGMLGLLTLAMLLPVSGTDTHASTSNGDNYCMGENGYLECDSNAKVSTYARVASVVSIGVQSNVVMDVTPKSEGAVMETPVELSVATNSAEGYALYMKALNETNALVSTNTSNKAEIKPINGKLIASELSTQPNTWGYAISNGNDTSSGASEDTNTSNEKEYQAIPLTQAEPIYTTNTLTSTNTEKLDLSFGLNVTTALPAGTYSNAVLISAVANPVKITELSELVFMQDMTPEICGNTAYDINGATTANTADKTKPVTKQLIDVRDGNSYWASKLADGNCWMVQNLAINLGEKPDNVQVRTSPYVKTLTPADSDVSSDWVVPVDTAFGLPGDGEPLDTGSYNIGEWVYLSSAENDKACDKLDIANLSECAESFVEVNNWSPSSTADMTGIVDNENQVYDAHYLIGNFYFPRIAYATDSTVFTQQNVETSICPKGWTLPTAGTWENGEIDYEVADSYNLFNSYGWTGPYKLNSYSINDPPINYFYYATALDADQKGQDPNKSPLYIIKTGYIRAGYLRAVSQEALLASSTGHNDNRFFVYGFSTSRTHINTAYSYARTYGTSVRCLAR